MNDDEKRYSPAALYRTIESFKQNRIVKIKPMFEYIDRVESARQNKKVRMGLNLYNAFQRWVRQSGSASTAASIKRSEFKMLDDYEASGRELFFAEIEKHQAEVEKENKILGDNEQTAKGIMQNLFRKISDIEADTMQTSVSTQLVLSEIKDEIRAIRAKVDMIATKIG